MNRTKPQHKHFINIIDFISEYCIKSKSFDEYAKEYYIDKDMYESSDIYFNTQSKKDMHGKFIGKKLKYDQRPLIIDPYLNNKIVSPVDGRIRGFHINTTSRLIIYNKIHKIQNLVLRPSEILGGSGFLARMCPQDYQGIFVPYSGYLTHIGIFGSNKKQKSLEKIPFMLTLRLISHYFMPPDVHERDYASVIYGNYIHRGVGVGAGTRWWPELLDVQPKTKLVYYLTVMGSTLQSSVDFSSPKLINLKNTLKFNQFNKINLMWLEQGEEIIHAFCGAGTVIFLTNRPIDFDLDIKHYSLLNNKKQDIRYTLKAPIDTYVKARDIMGAIL
jgi:hypothetical protein